MILDRAFQLLGAGAASGFASGGLERPNLPFERNPAAACPLDAEGLHVDVLLHLKRQRLSAHG